MFKMTSLLSRCVLALACLGGSAAALAGPTYHVNVDSTSQGNAAGYLALSFLSLDPQSPLTATVSNWTGAFAGTGIAYNDAAADFGSHMLTIGAGTNGYLFDVGFGGMFGFDVSFDGDNAAYETSFGVALSDLDGNYATGGDVANIVLGTSGPVQISANAAYASVTPAAVGADVPEPADWALVMTGLGLMGFSLRRRSR
jgi:hypothetical protein